VVEEEVVEAAGAEVVVNAMGWTRQPPNPKPKHPAAKPKQLVDYCGEPHHHSQRPALHHSVNSQFCTKEIYNIYLFIHLHVYTACTKLKVFILQFQRRMINSRSAQRALWPLG
jgi:hypothetical protein